MYKSIASIQATGNFLATYHQDLIFIRNFKRYKNGKIPVEYFVQKIEGTFYKFLIDYKVTRNYKKGNTLALLERTIEWISGINPDDVDGFANLLNRKKLTHAKTMTSLASKILFLNNPWEILPMDNRAKATVAYKGNVYSVYALKALKFKKENKETIMYHLRLVEPLLTAIEKEFKSEINDISTIRQNRLVDKILWTKGGKSK